MAKVIDLDQFDLELIKIIKNEPGIRQSEVAKRLGQYQGTTSYRLKILERGGLIKMHCGHGAVYLYPVTEAAECPS